MKNKGKSKLKEFTVYAAFIVIPILLGTYIYIALAPDTYPHILFERLFPGIDLTIQRTEENYHLTGFLRNYLCDFLWAFSLESCIMLIFNGCKRQLLISVIISSLFSVIIEVLQKFELIFGVFDIIDLACEIIAVILAGLIINFLLGGKSNENK